MKQFNSQKWVLSAFLVAALGSQYYFSVSSKDISSIEMSSTATLTPEQTQLVRDTNVILGRIAAAPVASPAPAPVASPAPAPVASPVPAPVASPVPAPVPAVVPTPVAAPAATARTTEGSAVVSAPCADCLVLTAVEAATLKRSFQLQIDLNTEDECNEGTTSEKMRCRRELLEEAKREAALVKKEKALEAARIKRENEEDALDERGVQFANKLEKASLRCREDMACMATEYASLLSRYTGSKKIRLADAQNAFRINIEPQLKAKLSSMDDTSTEANGIIAALVQGVPSEYRQIKEMVILDVKQAAVARAKSIKDTLTDAKAAADAKDQKQSKALIDQANAESYELQADIYGDPQSGREGYQNVLSGLKSSDSLTWAYAQSQLRSPIRALFTDMKTHYNQLFNAGLTSDQTPQSAQGTTRGSSRGGDNTSNNGVGPQLPGSQSSGTDSKLSQPVTGSTGFSAGPVTNTATGTRGPMTRN